MRYLLTLLVLAGSLLGANAQNQTATVEHSLRIRWVECDNTNHHAAPNYAQMAWYSNPSTWHLDTNGGIVFLVWDYIGIGSGRRPCLVRRGEPADLPQGLVRGGGFDAGRGAGHALL